MEHQQNQPQELKTDLAKAGFDSLFNNPQFEAMKKQLSQEDKDKYASIGKSMYEEIDYETSTHLNLPSFLKDALIYIIEGIKSGLHPSMLTEDEINVLKEAYGSEWYTNFGFKKEDITSIDPSSENK